MNNGQPTSESALDHPKMDDAMLVRRFANCRDEAAFAELVRRYSGLVYGVARRVLLHRQDAEDVFQAAFLVLARDAGDIRRKSSVASWLYGVAHRIALRLRAKRAAERQSPLKEETMDHADPFAELAQRSELQSLDEEINALPERDREPLVLRYLMGRSNKQIAEELDLTESAVESRLKRGRERLRKRLSRRGIGLAAVITAMELCRTSAEAAATNTLITGTIQAGLHYTSAGITNPLFSQQAAELAANEVSTMTTSTAASIGTLTLATTVVVALVSGLSGSSGYVAGDSGDSDPVLHLTSRMRKASSTESQPIRVAKGKKPANNEAAKPKARSTNATLDYSDASKIETALQGKTSLTIIDQTLTDACKIIEDVHGIKIIQLTKEMSDAGVDTDKLINHSLGGTKNNRMEITLASALNIILSEFDPPLTYVIEDQVLKITTVGNAEARLQTRVYETRHLKNLDPFELVKVIEATVKGPWKNTDGDGGVAKPVPGGLVIQQNYQAHLRVRKFLQQLGRQPELSDNEIQRFETKLKEHQKAEREQKQSERLQRIEFSLQRLERRLNLQGLPKKTNPPKKGTDKTTPGSGGGGFF